MEKLSQRFYEQIKSRIEGEIEGYMPEEYQLDIRYSARGTSGRGTSTLDIDVELPEGYVADITLRVHTSFYNDRGDYFTPPESNGSHSWEVTHLLIWDAEGELAEELNDSTYMEGSMSGKYQMTLTEEQIMLIANCVEDCHRFACGETELWNTIASMNGHGELRAKMKELHDFAVPELSANQYYDWAGSGCKDKSQKKFIAMTYAIYREILHKVVNAGVYKSHTLTCNEGGTPPRIAEVDEKNRKHKLTIIEFAKFGNFNSWVKYRADEKVLTFMGRFEQDENGMYLHTHIFDDGTEITFNF